MATALGTVVVVQETRFRLVTYEGRAELFLVAHGCAIEPQDLLALQYQQARVRVTYRPASGLVAGLATDVCDDS